MSKSATYITVRAMYHCLALATWATGQLMDMPSHRLPTQRLFAKTVSVVAVVMSVPLLTDVIL